MIFFGFIIFMSRNYPTFEDDRIRASPLSSSPTRTVCDANTPCTAPDQDCNKQTNQCDSITCTLATEVDDCTLKFDNRPACNFKSNTCDELNCSSDADCIDKFLDWTKCSQSSICSKPIRSYLTKDTMSYLVDDRLSATKDQLSALKAGAGSIYQYQTDHM